MAYLNIRRLKSPFDASLFLQGALRFPKQYRGDEVIMGLHGLTLVFSAPAGTVTFADASGAGLGLRAIMAKIKADVANLNCHLKDGVLFVVHATFATGVTLDGTTSTARDIFGFKNASIPNTKYNPPDGTAPRMVSFSDTGQVDGFILVTEES